MKTFCALLSFYLVLLTNKTFSQTDPCLGFPETNFTCGQNFTDVRDGRVYSTTQLGFQCWMAENLDFDTLGSVYYDNNPIYSVYGRLYTWNSAMGGAPHDEGMPGEVKGVCPNGWHISSNSEWLYVNSLMPSGGGATLKSTATDVGIGSWFSPNTGATNSTGFSALPGGYGVPYQGQGARAYFWTSTETNQNDAWYFSVGYNSAELIRTSTEKIKSLSVRCVKNCDFVALPVELAWFNVKQIEDLNVKLSWATVSEIESDYFKIERSINSVDWITLADVPSSGYSGQLRSYELVDEDPSLNIVNYYRLTEVSTSGVSEVLKTESLLVEVGNSTLKAWPNPVSFGETMNLSSKEIVRIVDTMGHLVYKGRAPMVVNFSSGVYTISLDDKTSPPRSCRVVVVQ